MKRLKGHARANALDDAVDFLLKGFATGRQAETFAQEFLLRFEHQIGIDGMALAGKIAHERYLLETGRPAPQIERAAEPVRQAPELGSVWPPAASGMR